MGRKQEATFFEVLEEQIRADLRKEIEKDVRAEIEAELLRAQRAGHSDASKAQGPVSDAWESLLATSLGKSFFTSSSKAQKAYHRPAQARPGSASSQTTETRANDTTEAATDARARQAAAPRLKPLNVEDLCAVELLRRHGGKLGQEFTEEELKSAWRKAALATHPDRFVQADAITQARMGIAFRELAGAYERLQAAFALPKAA